MTCRVASCGYEFCWVCMGDWASHGSATGGHYKCNKYDEQISKDVKLQKAERTREEAKNELAKYMFYYERYANHDKAAKHARTLLPIIKSKIELLNSLKSYPHSELEFLIDACNEVIRCRQVLKWTYAYGYYCINKN